MNAPVPPAQVPFILTSSPFVKKRILASSPPNSIIVSVSGSYSLAATLVAYTSCTKFILHSVATPIPADPEIDIVTFSSFVKGFTFSSISALFSFIKERCLW